MAQGACQAIEDAAVLSRLLSEATTDDAPAALRTYEAVRSPRAEKLQRLSRRMAHANHLPDGPDQEARDARFAELAADDTDRLAWLYGYDALAAGRH